jgi:translation initiation factor IF-3
MFRGRENTHPELGIKLIQRMAQSLADVSTIEKEPMREGARLHAILAPLPSLKPGKPKEESKEETGELQNAKT